MLIRIRNVRHLLDFATEQLTHHFVKTRNVKSHGPCSLHTVGQQRQKRVEKMSLNLVVFSEIIIKAQHISSVTPAQTIHSATMQPLSPSYGLACSGKGSV